MFNQKRLTFEQAWSVISDIAKACREFNELQFKYRQLALSVILAAYAAIGYFWVNADKGEAPPVTAGSSALPAKPEGLKEGKPAAESRPAESDRKSDSSNATSAKAAPSPETINRLEMIFFGIGLISAFTSWVIWQIDARYHRLLEANFNAAKDFEERLSKRATPNSPALIHLAMAGNTPESSVILSMSIFYWLAAIAGMLPWYAFVFLHRSVPWFGTSANMSGLVSATVLTAVFVASYYFGIKLKSSDTKKQYPERPSTDHCSSNSTKVFDGRLRDSARMAFKRAYCDYSDFAVGAAVLACNEAGEKDVFVGCNVENASYGLTMCAERNAIASAVAAGYHVVEQVLVYTDTVEPTPPCGACRQVIHEFGPQAKICLASPSRERFFKIEELLPHPFGKV